MTTSLMTYAQFLAARPGTLAVTPGDAFRIASKGHARWLAVEDGQVWITTTGDARRDGSDIWLAAGEGMLLAPGVEAVLEGRHRAAVRLAEMAPLKSSAWAAVPRGVAGWLRRERSALQWGAVTPPCVG